MTNCQNCTHVLEFHRATLCTLTGKNTELNNCCQTYKRSTPKTNYSKRQNRLKTMQENS